MTGADLAAANLTNTNLTGADLRECDMREIRWKQIQSIKWANVGRVKNPPAGFMAWAEAHGAVTAGVP